MWTYRAVVKRIVDGDTLDVDIDLGFKIKHGVRVRLHGVDTPEMHGVRRDSEEYRSGVKARDYVLRWLDEMAFVEVGDPAGKWEVMIKTYDGGPPRAGKYGRWIAEVFPLTSRSLDEEESLNAALLDAGHAIPYVE